MSRKEVTMAINDILELVIEWYSSVIGGFIFKINEISRQFFLESQENSNENRRDNTKPVQIRYITLIWAD